VNEPIVERGYPRYAVIPLRSKGTMQPPIGQNIGPYRVIERLGRGGMATVYKAYQPSLDRYVALKVLPAHLTDEPGFAERFRREARAVAKLEHPHILAVHDYGQEGDLTYIAMRYVEGGTLKALLGKPLDLPVIMHLIGQIAEALDYAHEHGVIHRDVKPSNVLLDRGNWTLLTDFGVARMVESTQQLTGTGVGVGTPAYMSPEQGQGKKVDRRSDVYSLGVVLYEMLTGRVPFEAETPLAVVWKHVNEPLPLPRSINPEIPEAVERVVLKALAKSPEDRFLVAGKVAGAVKSLEQAGPRARSYVPSETTTPGEDRGIAAVPRRRAMGKLRRRWYIAFALGAGVLAFGILRLLQAQGIVDALVGRLFLSTDTAPSATPVPPDGPEAVNEVELAEIARRSIGSGILSIAWSPDGSLVAVGSFDRSIRIYDASLDHLVHSLEGHEGAVTSVDWSPDSRQLASGSADRSIGIWDRASWRPILRIGGHENSVSSVAWSPDGTLLASGGLDQIVRVWDTRDGRRVAFLDGHFEAISSVAWSPDGWQLASAGRDGTVSIWDSTTWQVVEIVGRGGTSIGEVAWSPDGTSLVFGRSDGELWLVDAPGTGPVDVILGHTANARGVAWSPDSTMVASAGWDSTVRVWDVETRRALSVYSWEDSRAQAVAWSPDGSRLVVGRGDGTLLLLTTSAQVVPSTPEAQSG
jgi:serine/threonine protein kinase/DNA-binding beta-propeller fold protein YncE